MSSTQKKGPKTGSVSRDDYVQETEAAKLQVERDQDKDLQHELKKADQEGEQMQGYQEKQDTNYNPNNPREEDIERIRSGEGVE